MLWGVPTQIRKRADALIYLLSLIHEVTEFVWWDLSQSLGCFVLFSACVLFGLSLRQHHDFVKVWGNLSTKWKTLQAITLEVLQLLMLRLLLLYQIFDQNLRILHLPLAQSNCRPFCRLADNRLWDKVGSTLLDLARRFISVHWEAALVGRILGNLIKWETDVRHIITTLLRLLVKQCDLQGRVQDSIIRDEALADCVPWCGL